MKIIKVHAARTAQIQTDIGHFKVWDDGAINMWSDELETWAWFEPEKYSVTDIEAIRQAGLAAMK